MIKRTKNKTYWRSLDQLEGTQGLDEVIDHDFAAAAPPAQDGVSRRRWLQLMGASIAFGSIAGCRYPDEVIAPFAFRPHGRMPGVPATYATMLELGGIARPVVATSYDGRPIKLDGNPDHPDSRGASDMFTQATILELYDPDRSRAPARKAETSYIESTWDEGIRELKAQFATGKVAVLSEPNMSPSLGRLKKSLADRNPDLRWFEFTSVSSDNVAEGCVMAFGSVHRPIYQLEKAKVVVSIDADFMSLDPASVRLSGDYSRARDPDHHKMNRLYVVESDYSTTGSMADHRLAVRFGQTGAFLAALEKEIDKQIASPTDIDTSLSREEKILAAMAQDLAANRRNSVVMVGVNQPPEVHARAFSINSKLDNLGNTIVLEASTEQFKSGVDQLKELIDAIDAGDIESLLVLGGNPVFYAPSDLQFADALAKLKNSMHLSLYRDETSRQCNWHLNAAHPLECWGDGRSYDGSVCIAQPLIEPMFEGRSAIELLGILLGLEDSHGDTHADADHASSQETEAAAPVSNIAVDPHADQRKNLGLAIVKETVADKLTGTDPEAAWNKAVHDGFIAGTTSTSATPSIRAMNLTERSTDWNQPWQGGEAELVFRPSRSIYDGRFANNGWLQECPEFLTKLTWDNAAIMNPHTAEQLKLTKEKFANFKVGEHSISLPVFIVPGIPNGTVSTWLGYGRTAAGRVAGNADLMVESIGSDVRPLRSSGNWWSVPGVTATTTSTTYKLATTQDHFLIDDIGRDEINTRMGTGYTGKGSSMLREGTYESYKTFLESQSHDDGAESHEPTSDDNGSDENGTESHSEHGHAAQWPEGHHLHFENFDLTPAGWLNEPVPYKWGMSIDLNKCTGCNACVIACQAENNIPVVGKEQVMRGREMQWMRIDRYFIVDENDAEAEHPRIGHQPLTCQQCESAPCETVCPVAATTHSDEGLNDMVYNRCIGTRYCGNNCPYKVRRFNYFNYTDAQTFLKVPGADRLKRANLSLQNMMMNPEVTIRSRGVMEKCTYCVQRIQNIKIKAKTEGNRKIRANEIATACQDVCPSNAIAFGDIQNEESNVHKAHHNPRAYQLLDELNVHPRTKFLARVRNPHPALAAVDPPTDAVH